MHSLPGLIYYLLPTRGLLCGELLPVLHVMCVFLRGGGNSRNFELGGKGGGRRSEDNGLAAAETLVKHFQTLVHVMHLYF